MKLRIPSVPSEPQVVRLDATKLRILILDDDKIRHDTLNRIYEGHEIVSAYRYSEFVERFDEGNWDIIHLDHFDDNRNTDRTCQKCGEKITCATAGGHYFPAGEAYCKYGCGTHQ